MNCFVVFELGFDGFLMLWCLFGFLGLPFSDGKLGCADFNGVLLFSMKSFSFFPF